MVKEPVPMGPGPWGGVGGRAWDDGVYTGVKQIYIMRGAFIGSIQIEYDRSGHSVWSSRHGNSGHITHRVSAESGFSHVHPPLPGHAMSPAYFFSIVTSFSPERMCRSSWTSRTRC